MDKPNWRLNFWKHTLWYWKPRFHKNPLLWKDKHGSPRVELCPFCSLNWGYWEVYLKQGSDTEWELYLWVMKYCYGSLSLGLSTWPWKHITKT